jgi:hypothetical protein
MRAGNSWHWMSLGPLTRNVLSMDFPSFTIVTIPCNSKISVVTLLLDTPVSIPLHVMNPVPDFPVKCNLPYNNISVLDGTALCYIVLHCRSFCFLLPEFLRHSRSIDPDDLLPVDWPPPVCQFCVVWPCKPPSLNFLW